MSPFLFIIVQSILFHDIYELVHLDEEPPFFVTQDLLYADDMALLCSSPKNLQVLLDAVVSEYAKYGLQINWGKISQVNVNTDENMYRLFFFFASPKL